MGVVEHGRFRQWQPCPEDPSHLADWTPLADQDDPRWYVLCQDCNIEGYVKPTWLNGSSSGEDRS